jgi:hypothetical protein
MRKLIYAINLTADGCCDHTKQSPDEEHCGRGRRLMEGVSLPQRLQLKLAESKIFKSGCVALRYLKQ